jgi:hypothetical protein
MNKGVFVLSLDTELAWGTRFDEKLLISNQYYYERTRESIQKLLALFERYNISATWAFVGHLFLSECEPTNNVKHPEIVRPQYNWLKSDWFSIDPCTNVKDDPIWYGKDILEAVKSCKIHQEIGCHTFSHIIAGYPGYSRECLDSELKMCQSLAIPNNIVLRSFVFPKNREEYIDILANNGFTCYRGKEPNWYNVFPDIIQKFLYFTDSFLFFTTPPLIVPTKDKIWNIQGSYFYGHCDGLAKLSPVSFRVSKIKRGIYKAAKEAKVFHLWFHPCNLATNPDKLIAGLDDIFSYVLKLTNQGILNNLTMGKLEEKMENES